MSHLNQLIQKCDALIQQRKISDAKQVLEKVLITNENFIPALERLFSIALSTQEFSRASSLLEQLNALDTSLVSRQLRSIHFYEVTQDYFKLVLLMKEHLKHNKNVELEFKLALNALKVGDIEQAETSFSLCEEQNYSNPFLLLNIGHMHKAKGDSQLAAKYYNQFIDKAPEHCGTGYWSLADLKNYNFSQTEQDKIKFAIEQNKVNIGNIALLSFALAKNYEQSKEFSLAFKSLEKANSIIAKYRPFKAQLFSTLIDKLICCDKATFSNSEPKTKEDSFQPIFIVGMPRSGSTLIEQILASHSAVQATDELPYIERIALALEKKGGLDKQLASMSETQRLQLAQEYKEQAMQYVNDNCNVVIDKNPNNFLHIGLIKKLFPHATIINIVRNPLDNALSVYKQYFSHGHEYSYSLNTIAIYWEEYLRLMRFWNNTFPKGILNISYEEITKSPEDAIRQLISYCDLKFETACLTFYRSKRAVLTPSVNQVKKPINNSSVNSWKGYEESITNFIPRFERICTEAGNLIDK
ncbi:MAG: tetratricopeptide repeat-containing sulfotransferase family protein [Colwellia sp.]